MRVLVIASRPTDGDRGDPSPPAVLVRGLLERGHEVHLVCDASEPMRSYDALTVWTVRPERSLVKPQFASRARAAARAVKPQLVLAERTHLATGWSVTKRFGGTLIPLLSEDGDRGGSAVSNAARVLDAKLIRGAPACVACGPSQADAALQDGAQRVIELPGISSIDPIDRPPSGWLRRHLKLDRGVLAIAWGDLSPDDGTDILIEGVKGAADADHDVHLAVFGGDETTVDRYDAKAQRLGIHDRVHLLGGWHASKLDTLLPEGDMLIDASIRPHRAPRALYSFLASHRPVILTEALGRERFADPKACVITPADRLGIGHALSQLAANESARSHYADAGRRAAAARHTFDAFIAALEPLERLVASGPRSATPGTDATTAEAGRASGMSA